MTARKPEESAPSGDDQTPQKIRGMFSAISPSYDRLNHLLSGSLDRRWRARAAREALAGLNPCRRVLDVATGTGDLAAELGRAMRAPGGGANGETKIEVVGADFTRAMLRQATVKYPARRHAWVEADGLRLPVASGAFDALTIAFGLRNMVDKRAALREFARALRPGGRIVILEFGQPRNPLIRAGYDFYSFSVLPRVGQLISGSDAYLYLAKSIRSFWSAGELVDELQGAGFRDVAAIPLLFGVVYLHVATRG